MMTSIDGNQVASTWKKVFRDNDAFDWPFQPNLTMKRVFYPTDGYHLTEAQYEALIGALRALGEDRFLLSVCESEGTKFFEEPEWHWECVFPSYEAYSSLGLTLENTLYSPRGTWGIIISHEMHALIGGSPSFECEIGNRYVDWTRDLTEIKEAWEGAENVDWLDDVIGQVRL